MKHESNQKQFREMWTIIKRQTWSAETQLYVFRENRFGFSVKRVKDPPSLSHLTQFVYHVLLTQLLLQSQMPTRFHPIFPAKSDMKSPRLYFDFFSPKTWNTSSVKSDRLLFRRVLFNNFAAIANRTDLDLTTPMAFLRWISGKLIITAFISCGAFLVHEAQDRCTA